MQVKTTTSYLSLRVDSVRTSKKRLIDLGINDVFLRSSNKIQVYNGIKEKYDIEDQQVLYMGDDIPDIPVLKVAGVSCCPQDAAIDVKQVVDYHSPIDGGKGCVREVIEQTLRVQGKWLSKNAFQW